MGLYLVKKNIDSGFENDDSCAIPDLCAKGHPVVLCTVETLAMCVAGPTQNRAWMWSKLDPHSLDGGWLLQRWEGFGLYGSGLILPDGYVAGAEHYNTCAVCDCTDEERLGCGPFQEKGFDQHLSWTLLPMAAWWSFSPVPAWIREYFPTVCLPDHDEIDRLHQDYNLLGIPVPKRRLQSPARCGSGGGSL